MPATTYQPDVFADETTQEVTYVATPLPERKGKHVKVNGRRIFYLERGQGKPLVVLHGWGMDHTAWAPATDLLASRYRVIAVDLRGHGQSDAAQSPYAFNELSDDVFALLQQLELNELPIVVGHSMGGMVAQQFAADHPQAIDGLVVLDADLNGPPALRAVTTLAGHVGAGVMSLASWILGEKRALSLYPMVVDLSAYSWAWQGKNRDQLRAGAQRFPQHNSTVGLASSFRAIATRPNLALALNQAAPRALLIRGSADLFMPQVKMEALARTIPGSRLEVLPGAGHMTIVEQPKVVAGLIDAFARQAQ
jgi:3-oxoadipate enol-lactonase